MQKRIVISLLLVLALSSCARVPITGRRQLSLVAPQQVNALATEEYSAFLKESKLSGNAEATATVKRVGAKIAGAVELYFKRQGRTQGL